jgi:hypothetical protein
MSSASLVWSVSDNQIVGRKSGSDGLGVAQMYVPGADRRPYVSEGNPDA